MSQYKSGEITMNEEYYFQIAEEIEDDRVFVLVIYDVIDNKRRTKFAKLLSGYGFRVQKSAFEATLSKKKLNKLMEEIPNHIDLEDSVRVYKIRGKGQVTTWGTDVDTQEEDIILI